MYNQHPSPSSGRVQIYIWKSDQNFSVNQPAAWEENLTQEDQSSDSQAGKNPWEKWDFFVGKNWKFHGNPQEEKSKGGTNFCWDECVHVLKEMFNLGCFKIISSTQLNPILLATFLTWRNGKFSLEMNLISMTFNFEMHPDFTLQNMNVAPKSGRALIFSNILGHAWMFTLEGDQYIYSTWNIVGDNCRRIMQWYDILWCCFLLLVTKKDQENVWPKLWPLLKQQQSAPEK